MYEVIYTFNKSKINSKHVAKLSKKLKNHADEDSHTAIQTHAAKLTDENRKRRG